MEKIPTCFFAYASQPTTVSEVIEECIEKINDGQTVVMKSWKTANVSGKFIMQEICKEIDKNDFFACDITCLNPNVLFELGYAIARKKRVWISRDTSIDESNKDYTRLKLLTTVGYAPYTNCEGLIRAFYNDRPYDDLDSTIYKTIIESITKDKKDLRLLYSKSLHETEASVRTTRRINKSKIPLIIDDPTEAQTQTFNWYIENIFFSWGVLVHLVAPIRYGWQLHNAKLALVSGLAYGFGNHLLMLVEEPYESPIDYRDLLRSYKTAKQCENYVNEWLSNIEPEYEEKRSGFEDYREEVRRQFELTNISLGEYVAENESDQISNYFVSTAPYLEALRAQQTIFVGRKGTGKTANLYKIVDELSYDKRNHVCVIKPVAYELEGLTKMLQQSLPKSEQGYLIESFWKFLIYTELAKSIIDILKTKPLYYEYSKAEKKLYDFVQKYSNLIENEFSIRLEQVVNSLCNINSATSAAAQRTRISEILHSKIIGELRILLGEVLEKNNRIVILIDNLDKTWKERDDLPDLCKLLLGLLSVIKTIKEEFQKTASRKTSINLSLILFLRSDIFNFIMGQARERDKISYSLLNWDDKELLLRVIEERFSSACDALLTPSDIWTKYFCPTVRQVPIKDYLLKCIIPRPRDMIFICKASIGEAVTRAHTIVEEQDVLDGEKKYSQYVFDSLLVENGIRVEELEKILYEFAGAKKVLSHTDTTCILRKAEVGQGEIDYVINILLDLTFLGLEIEENVFVFLYNENDKQKYHVLAKKLVDSLKTKEKRYAINKPFHAYLEIKD